MTVLVNAAVSQRGREGICRIRNVSVGGLAIETQLSLFVGEEAIITLSTGRELSCMVQWIRDGRAGLSCSSDAAALLRQDRAERSMPLPGPALPRFYPIANIMIRVHGRQHRCALDSVSTSDILLSGTPALTVGERVAVTISGLGEFPATVQICQDGDLFARFTPQLPFRLMNEWLAGQK